MNRKDADRHARAKRTAALARPELREDICFISVESELPEEGRLCTVWAASDEFGGIYRLPFHVCRKLCVSPTGIHYTEWHHARFDNLIQVRIVGWIYAS